MKDAEKRIDDLFEDKITVDDIKEEAAKKAMKSTPVEKKAAAEAAPKKEAEKVAAPVEKKTEPKLQRMGAGETAAVSVAFPVLFFSLLPFFSVLHIILETPVSEKVRLNN